MKASLKLIDEAALIHINFQASILLPLQRRPHTVAIAHGSVAPLQRLDLHAVGNGQAREAVRDIAHDVPLLIGQLCAACEADQHTVLVCW